VRDAPLYFLVLVAVLACPMHMWWANRQGRRPTCCLPPPDPTPRDLDALRERRGQIEARIAALDPDVPAPQVPAGSHYKESLWKVSSPASPYSPAPSEWGP
jgi:hypothetical protein